MWFYLILAAGLIFTLREILGRKILLGEEESLAYTFVQQAMTALLILPVALLEWQKPVKEIYFLYLILVGIWDALSVFLVVESIRYLEVSLRTVLWQGRIILLIFLGNIFLGEVLNWQKFWGGLLIFSGVALVTWRKNRISRLKLLWTRLRNGQNTQKEKGIMLTLAAGFSLSFQLIAMKYLLDLVGASVLLFFLAGTGTVVYSLVLRNLKEKIRRLPRLTFLNHALAPVGGYLFFKASEMAEVTKTVPVVNAFAVLTVLAGVIFLKEQEGMWRKILGSLAAVAGVVLVKIA